MQLTYLICALINTFVRVVFSTNNNIFVHIAVIAFHTNETQFRQFSVATLTVIKQRLSGYLPNCVRLWMLEVGAVAPVAPPRDFHCRGLPPVQKSPCDANHGTFVDKCAPTRQTQFDRAQTTAVTGELKQSHVCVNTRDRSPYHVFASPSPVASSTTGIQYTSGIVVIM